MVLGWREWGDQPKVVIYKDLENFEKFDRSVVQPNVREVVLDVLYGHDQPGNGNCRGW